MKLLSPFQQIVLLRNWLLACYGAFFEAVNEKLYINEILLLKYTSSISQRCLKHQDSFLRI